MEPAPGRSTGTILGEELGDDYQAYRLTAYHIEANWPDQVVGKMANNFCSTWMKPR